MNYDTFQFKATTQFDFKATIDFIVLRVVLQRASNGWSMSDRMMPGEKDNNKRRIYADPVDKGDGAAATTFDLRIHDPKNYAHIENTLRLVERRLYKSGNAFAMPPEIRQIEISFDAFPKKRNNQSPTELAEFAVRFTEWIQRPAGRRRTYRKKREEEKERANYKRQNLIRLVQEGWMIGMGNSDSQHFQRAYYKTKDAINLDKDEWRDLPKEEHRARFENNFSGGELTKLSLMSMEDLKTFRFEKLSKCFSFRIIKKPAEVDPILLTIESCYSIPLGKLKQRETRTGMKIIRTPHTTAFAALNQKARQALTDLSNRWGNAKNSRPRVAETLMSSAMRRTEPSPDGLICSTRP